MTLEGRWSRRLAGLSLAALVGVAPATGYAAEAGAAPVVPQAKAEEIDAELLRDLELLSSPDYARDREIAKRLSFLERLRALQALPWGASQPPTTGAAPSAGQAKVR